MACIMSENNGHKKPLNVKLLQNVLYLHFISFLWLRFSEDVALMSSTSKGSLSVFIGGHSGQIFQRGPAQSLAKQTQSPHSLHSGRVVVLHARMIQSVQTSSPFYFSGFYLGEGALPSALLLTLTQFR